VALKITLVIRNAKAKKLYEKFLNTKKCSILGHVIIFWFFIYTCHDITLEELIFMVAILMVPKSQNLGNFASSLLMPHMLKVHYDFFAECPKCSGIKGRLSSTFKVLQIIRQHKKVSKCTNF
jgi:hypothetical protein